MTLKEQISSYTPYNEQEASDKELMLHALDTLDDVLTRENIIAHFTASAWIVNSEHTKVIVAYHKIYDEWAWTGGHADGNADLLAVAQKEVGEETGLDNLKVLSDGIYAIQVLPVEPHIKRGKYVSSHLHLDCCFLFEADESMPLCFCPNENNGVKWVDISAPVKLTKEPKMVPIYAKLNEKLKTV